MILRRRDLFAPALILGTTSLVRAQGLPFPGPGAKTYSSFANTTTFGPSTITTGNGLNGFTVRIVIIGSAISTSGIEVQLTFTSGIIGTGAFTSDAVYIGAQAPQVGPAEAWDFATTPTQITWSGSGNMSIPTTVANTDLASDIVNFVIDETENYVVAWHGTSSGNNCGEGAASPSGWTTYKKSGVNEAATVNPTGYSSDARIWGLKKGAV